MQMEKREKKQRKNNLWFLLEISVSMSNQVCREIWLDMFPPNRAAPL